MDPELLKLLCCPVTRQPLRDADPEVLARHSLEAGLIREDGQVLYPVVNGIPVLLADEGIVL